MTNLLGWGANIPRIVAAFGAQVERVGVVLWRAAAGFRWMRLAAFVNHLGRLALGAAPLTALATGLAGAVTAMQSAQQLSRLGAAGWVVDLAGVGFATELGPLLAGLLLAAKAGSGIASEVGLLVFDGQLRALAALGLSVDGAITAPRLAAAALGGLLLAILAIGCGWLGALAVCSGTLGMDSSAFWSRLAWAVSPVHLATGMMKGLCFGLAVGAVSLSFALRDKPRGAASVGEHTMRAVVASSGAVLLLDPVLAGVFRWGAS